MKLGVAALCGIVFGAGHEPAQFGAGGKEKSGLAFDDAEIILARQDLPLFLDLVEFPLAHNRGNPDQQLKDFGPQSGQGEIERLRVEIVGHQNGDAVRPLRVNAWAAPPRFGLVDDVIVQQRGDMEQFKRGGQFQHRLVGTPATDPRRENGDGGPQLLAGCFHQVMAYVADQRALRSKGAVDQFVHSLKIVFETGIKQIKQSGGTHCLNPSAAGFRVAKSMFRSGKPAPIRVC